MGRRVRGSGTGADGRGHVLRTVFAFALTYAMLWSLVPAPAIAEAAQEAADAASQAQEAEARPEGDAGSGEGADGVAAETGQVGPDAQGETPDGQTVTPTGQAAQPAEEPAMPASEDEAARLVERAAQEVRDVASARADLGEADEQARLVATLFDACIASLEWDGSAFSLASADGAAGLYRELAGMAADAQAPAFEALRELLARDGSEAGVSSAFARVVRALGVECVEVEGANGAHWPMVRVGDAWYHADPGAAAKAVAARGETPARDAAHAWLLVSDEAIRTLDVARDPWGAVDKGVKTPFAKAGFDFSRKQGERTTNDDADESTSSKDDGAGDSVDEEPAEPESAVDAGKPEVGQIRDAGDKHAVSEVPSESAEGEDGNVAEAPVLQTQAAFVQNPRVVADSSMESGQVTTWDCVWFGSYPQEEVLSSDEGYQSLQTANWDEAGDTQIGSTKYKRLIVDGTNYRYFRYDPIKWRVLRVGEGKAFLISDVGLDCQPYNVNEINVTWRTCSVRSWLNCYGIEENDPGIDYSANGFLRTAFTNRELSAIQPATLDSELAGDLVFLPSESQVWGSDAVVFGFSNDSSIRDEGRRCKATDYSCAKGLYTEHDSSLTLDGYCYWWVRTEGANSWRTPGVFSAGSKDAGGGVGSDRNAPRPAMYIDLASDKVAYAGTVSSNGEVDQRSAPDPTQIIVNNAKCGPDLYWSYKNGALSISGYGPMTSHPWNTDYDLEGSITSLSLLSDITSICDDAFRDCAAIRKSTKLPESLTHIGSGAFYGCSSLQSAPLPEGITSIEEYTFAHCTSLNLVTFPSSVKSIGDAAFGDCDALWGGDVYWQGTEQTWNALPKGQSNEALEHAKKHFSDRRVIGVNYGQVTYAPTPEERILQLALEYEGKADWYVEELRQAAKEEEEACKKAGAQDGVQALRDVNGTALDKVFAGAGMPEDCKQAAYKALAEYFEECRSEAVSLELGDTLTPKSIDSLRESMGNFDNYTKRIDGHQVTIEALPSFMTAYVLHLKVDGENDSVVCSSPDDTARVLNAYTKQLKKLADNAKYNAIIAVASDLDKAVGIGSWSSESLLKKFLSKKVAKMNDGHMKSACNGLLKIWQGYEVTKKITKAADAKDIKDFSGLGDPQDLYDKLVKVDLDELTLLGVVGSKVFSGVGKSVKYSKEALVKALSDYIGSSASERQSGTWLHKMVERFTEDVNSALKVHTVQCPVDVYVYGADGKELGRIVNGEVVCDESIAMRLDGDVKTVVIPSSVDASVRLVGTGSGSMSYVVEQVVGGEATGRANWYDISLGEGRTFTQEVSAEAMGVSSVDPLVTDSGDIAASEYIPVSKEACVSVTASAGEGGAAVGTGTYVRGDSVTLSAYPDERYAFEGWYEGDKLVSTSLAYRFTALDDASLEARFWLEEAKDEDYVSVVDKRYAGELGLVMWYDAPVKDNIMVGVACYEGQLPKSLSIRKLDGSGGVIEERSCVPEIRNGAWLIVRGVDLSDAVRTEVLMPDGSRIGTIYPAGADIPGEDGGGNEDDIASGTWGTCAWEIDAKGKLTVHAGQGAYTSFMEHAPWFVDHHNVKIRSVVFERGVILPRSISYLFAGCPSLTYFDFSGWDTSSVERMESLFYGCSSLTSLDLSDWDMSGVTDMDGMFLGCSSLTTLKLSGWDTSSVEDMSALFYGCSSLTSLDLSGWNTSSVMNMYQLFKGCSSLSSINLSGWDTSSVTYASSMFDDCSPKRFRMGRRYEIKDPDMFPSERQDHKWRSQATGRLYTRDEIVLQRSGVADTYTQEATGTVDPPSSLSVFNPRIVADPSMEAGQRVTWDCVWFGSYPQTEITPGDAVYASLKTARWDANGDATVGGVRYRRISREDATYDAYWSDDGYGSATYRYFRYEPIKWRVLDAASGFVVADVALDGQRYNMGNAEVTWEISSVRSWLNGYGGESNQPGVDYSGGNFFCTAFPTLIERDAVRAITVKNAPNLENGTAGGSDTRDKVLLLSESDLYGVDAGAYGFVSDCDAFDEARRCRPSDYAHAMGAYRDDGGTFDGNCWWWSRSPGYRANEAACVRYTGAVQIDFTQVDSDNAGIRPALSLDLASPTVAYAGTVSSDGTVDERVPKADITDASVSAIAVQTWSGREARPAPTVKLGGRTLVKGSDYALAYKDNVNAGTAIVIITGMGDYMGSKSVTFTIKKAASKISLAAQAKAYNGKAQAYSGKVTKSGSAGKVTFKYYSDAKCTREVKAANVKKAGTYYVKATLAADANHVAATSAAARLTIAKAASKISIAAQTKAYTGKAVAYTGKVTKSGSAGRVTYRYYSDAACKREVKAASVKAAGTYYVRATVAADANHKAATSAPAKLTVKAPSVTYQTHVQGIGDQGWRKDGAPSGTFGQAKRLEGIWIKLGSKPVSGSIRYRTHVQGIGDQAWRGEGQMSGTHGQAKRLEAIQIELTGSMAKHYDVFYRVHAQHFGWMGWARNGERSGTAGYAYRLEAIQIVLLPKGSKAPSASYGGYRQATSAPFARR